nr:DNA alkylation repair protein [Deltaproteobacteria bacterium]
MGRRSTGLAVPLDPVADLKRRLRAKPGSDTVRAYWSVREWSRRTRLRKVIDPWWHDHGFDGHPAAVGKRVALALIAQPRCEPQIAGITILYELLGDQLRASDLPMFARLFTEGHLVDVNLVDWFAIKVLGALLDREPGRPAVVRAIADWRTAETTWQRRAACLAFLNLAATPSTGLTTTILSICAAVIWGHERTDQLAAGRLLATHAKVEPARVEA